MWEGDREMSEENASGMTEPTSRTKDLGTGKALAGPDINRRGRGKGFADSARERIAPKEGGFATSRRRGEKGGPEERHGARIAERADR